jgi:diguanylate cyclase (GGDEF)-like protein
MLGAAHAQTPITSVRQITELTNAQAGKNLPVKLEATITFVQPLDGTMFIADGDSGVYVAYSKEQGLQPGDRVLVLGKTSSSFRPEIAGDEVRFLAHGKMPKAQPAKFEELIGAKWDSRYVEFEAHVLSAAMEPTDHDHSLRLQLSMPHGVLEANIANPGNLRPEDLLEADVRLSGVAGGAFDSRMHMAGVWLDVNSWREVEILKPPSSDPWAAPLVAPDQVYSAYRSTNASQRVRVSGTLTYFEPGALAVVEKDGNGIPVETRSSLPLHAGVGVEATGFPEISEENLRLEDGQLRSRQQSVPVEPVNIKWDAASVGSYAYSLVAMEGEVVAEVHDSRVDLFVILSEGHLFSATMRHSSADAFSSTAVTPKIAVGSRVRAVGVCFVDTGNHWRDRLWFDLRMRSLRDISVLQEPAWWTVKRMAYIVTLLGLAILIAVAWVWTLQRRVLQQTALIARKTDEESERERERVRREQQRSHILEMISSPEPLSSVMQEITDMISARLDGSPCWFELYGDTTPEDAPRQRSGTPGLQKELFARDGRLLGLLLATPKPRAATGADISSAMQVGAQLAGLAIETRRLYSDLRHRSEHDLLTDIPNRFSMEKELDLLMESARTEGRRFGVIYVDLDRFKQVNDNHGHRTGDLYLQAVTRRMQQQMRGGDFLARIGGDEFMALVPIRTGRKDAEEIARRLERCFDEPFALEELLLRGSASVGLAVYPDDGATKEELQRWADAAMYAHKQGKSYEEDLAGTA